jgi:thymidine kinase
MARITFLTGTMASGKTTHLLQTHFNIEAAFPTQVLLVNRNDRMGSSICSSRMGGMTVCETINTDDSLVSLIDNHNHTNQTSIKYLFVDEAQFLTSQQVDELVELADLKDIEIYAYGLLTNFKGSLFSASQRLIEVCDRLIQLDNGVRCWCGNPATHNALFISGEPHVEGADEVVDASDMVEYRVMCRKHFTSHRNHQSKTSSKVNRTIV